MVWWDAVAPMRNIRTHAFDQVDLYGRREQLQGAVIGIFSEPSNAAATLVADIVFEK